LEEDIYLLSAEEVLNPEDYDEMLDLLKMTMEAMDCPFVSLRCDSFEIKHFAPHVKPWVPYAMPFSRQVRTSGRPCIILDSQRDVRVPLSAKSALQVRYFTGAPVLARDGRCLGALCAADFEPRGALPDDSQIQALRALTDSAAGCLENAFQYIERSSDLPQMVLV
jgi:GAF domain-containing protein